MSRGSLILTLTRACDLRCSYCPTAKSGWPSLDEDAVRRAFALFTGRFGGGDVKLFGGEPLLEPALVRLSLKLAAANPAIRWIYLSTNGLALTEDLLAELAEEPKLVLTVSMDGQPEDHRRLRRALPTAEGRDAYAHLVSLMPHLRRMPRAVVTQTIAPATARNAMQNFLHLRELGWWRFNFLPGYYLPWRDDQLAMLSEGFDAIATRIRRTWEARERLYVRNLFTLAPTPFFNTGLIVDADGAIHASNVGLSSSLSDLLERTRVGSLPAPPTPEALEARAREIPALLEEAVPADVLASTRAVDDLLSRFCRELYPAYLADRRRRRAA